MCAPRGAKERVRQVPPQATPWVRRTARACAVPSLLPATLMGRSPPRGRVRATRATRAAIIAATPPAAPIRPEPTRRLAEIPVNPLAILKARAGCKAARSSDAPQTGEPVGGGCHDVTPQTGLADLAQTAFLAKATTHVTDLRVEASRLVQSSVTAVQSEITSQDILRSTVALVATGIANPGGGASVLVAVSPGQQARPAKPHVATQVKLSGAQVKGDSHQLS